ncbi:bsr7779 [Bradyrhizobium diazoefficiens USDA 110]|uniref:Bsr7779 protein n=1 Tax=Bradyrhizobium diazoefficiens (strain JCM 10833 / BCRC 13528 / IAM 13628 / NBRC 14792 / USDA 110) TaxID=224911 RepID=Q89CL8_BRADU|nr:hypothetical protein CO678_25255 [Bradyrhizobium diazoefficiens]QBP26514.1 hypothetical protein Bdiaspc4_41160 [Bradyrhizobium diazoefficiens]QHP73900.1 hypothetical protein EI171_45655 [Bradyrhizobium sp. LCT2]BAC53044.1 bsr7779 [Bradyrhizobium diazoefficiens USDA 110]
MSSDDAEWLDASRRSTWQDRSGFAGWRPLEVPIIGRNGGGQQDRTAPQCRSLSLISIKQPAENDVYG